jgi:hypothetical protein
MEKWNGTAWSAGVDYTNTCGILIGSGSSTDGIAGTGRSNGTIYQDTYKWNGTAWSSGGNIGVTRRGGGSGTNGLGSGGALFLGGYDNSTTTSKHNGTVWASAGSFASSGYFVNNRGFGTSSAGYNAGGYVAATSALTQSYNGTAWATSTAMTQDKEVHATAGSQTAGLAFAGYRRSPAGVVKTTYSWNGSAWTTETSSGNAIGWTWGAGSAADALLFGGTTSDDAHGQTWVEEYVTFTWVAKALSDTGASAVTLPMKAKSVLADTGTSTVVESNIKMILQILTEAGLSSDSTPLTAKMLVSQAGVSIAALVMKALAELPDAGVSADVFFGALEYELIDVGLSADVIALIMNLPLADPGTSSDTMPMTVKMERSDTGTSSALLLLKALVGLSDPGVSADSILGSVKTLLIDDGLSGDSITVLAKVLLAQAGLSGDAIGMQATMVVLDSGLSSDSWSYQWALGFSEAAVSTVLETMRARMSIGEAGLSVESITKIVLTYGASVEIVPSPKHYGIVPLQIKLTTTGTYLLGETVSIRVHAKYSDNTYSTYVFHYLTAEGDHWFTESEMGLLFKDGVYITKLIASACSYAGASSVNCYVTANCFQQ